jgi:hypothetical protein
MALDITPNPQILKPAPEIKCGMFQISVVVVHYSKCRKYKIISCLYKTKHEAKNILADEIHV